MEIILLFICLFLSYKIYLLQKSIDVLTIAIETIRTLDNDFWSED